MKHLLSLLLLLLPAAGMLRAQGVDSSNMSVYAHVNPSTATGLHASLWGYTAPDGREYALFGAQNGLYIYDISTLPLRKVAFIAGPFDTWREAKTYKQYAYVSTEGGALQVIDLSTLPDTARKVAEITEPVGATHTIQIDGHYLYAMGTSQAGAVIMDLEPDPLRPRLAGRVSSTYFHDAFIRNDTLVGAGIYGQGAEIWDIRDKENPTLMGVVQYPNSGTHNAELTPDGKYVVTSDEIGGTDKTMKVWDIRDLDNITRVANFTPDTVDIIHNVHLIGRYAYVAWYTAGVRVIDMIDPTSPREVAFYDTYDGPGNQYNGVWEVYAHFASGKIIASDRSNGLWVLKLDKGSVSSVAGRPASRSFVAAPNPVAAGSTLDLGVRERGTFELFDAMGRRMMSADVALSEGRVRIGNELAPGVYLGRVVTEREVMQVKIVVE